MEVEDPYIRSPHQVTNFLRFCETLVRHGETTAIELVTNFEHQLQEDEVRAKLYVILDSLKERGVSLKLSVRPTLHDREVRLSNGWRFRLGRGLDLYQRPEDWLAIGATDLDLRRCLETHIDIFRAADEPGS